MDASSMVNAQGYCKSCGKAMVSVNGENKCLPCEGKRQIVKVQTNIVKDPGHEAMVKMLHGQVASPIKGTTVVTNAGSIEDALRSMKSLPMPDDIKKFKQIKKIIKLLEDLVNPQE